MAGTTDKLIDLLKGHTQVKAELPALEAAVESGSQHQALPPISSLQHL